MDAIQINIYDSEIDTLIDLLSSLNSPTGDAVVSRIIAGAVTAVEDEDEDEYLLINVTEDTVIEYLAAELVYLAYDGMFEGDE